MFIFDVRIEGRIAFVGLTARALVVLLQGHLGKGYSKLPSFSIDFQGKVFRFLK
jgi:hypothetical protein